MDIKTLLIMTLLSILNWDYTGTKDFAWDPAGRSKKDFTSNPKRQNEPYRIRPPPPE